LHRVHPQGGRATAEFLELYDERGDRAREQQSDSHVRNDRKHWLFQLSTETGEGVCGATELSRL
jgi:hypothetical protein